MRDYENIYLLASTDQNLYRWVSFFDSKKEK